jgi:hypothetical protein
MRDYTYQTGSAGQATSWTSKLEDARGELGFAEAVGKIPQTDYENQMKRVEEIRQQKTGQGRIDEDEARMRRLQDQIDNFKGLSTNNHQESLAAASAAYAKGDQAEGDRLSKLAHDQLRIKRRGSRN